MNNKLLAVTFIGVFMATFVIIFYSIILSSSQFSKRVTNGSNDWTIESTEEFRGNFMIYQIRYLNPSGEINDSIELCDFNELSLVTDILFRINHLPDNCEIFLNGKFKKEYDIALPDKIGGDNESELKQSISLGLVDISKEHSIEVCCDGICAEKRAVKDCP